MLKKIFGRLALLLVAVAVVVLSMVLVQKLAGADENSYAKARTEAMKKRESAFRSISLPEEVITQFLRVTKKPGEKVLIVAGEEFESVVVRGTVYHGVVIAPEDVPMPAEKWQVHWGKRIFSTFLVFPKGNSPFWSFRIMTDETITAIACAAEVAHIPINVARAT